MFGIQYVLAGTFGLTLGLVLLGVLGSVWITLAAAAGPTVLLSLALVRHAKAMFLAVDHYFDPHRKSPVIRGEPPHDPGAAPRA